MGYVYRLNGLEFEAPLNTIGYPFLRDMDLTGAVFEGSWKHADFSGSLLDDAQFECVDLRHAIFDKATLGSANFRGANMHDARLKFVCAYHADFRYADLSYTRMHSARMSNANFTGARLEEAILTGVDFEDAIGVRGFIGIAEWGPLYVFSEKWIKVGCRWFTLEEAREHWKYKGRRRETLALVELCAERGWIRP